MDHDDSSPAPAHPVAPPPAGRLGEPLVHPHDADPGRDATRWGAPTADYAAPADGSAAWASGLGEPAGVPPLLPGVAGPHIEPGWLMAGRQDPGPPA